VEIEIDLLQLQLQQLLFIQVYIAIFTTIYNTYTSIYSRYIYTSIDLVLVLVVLLARCSGAARDS
jgi:hypothetical protein